ADRLRGPHRATQIDPPPDGPEDRAALVQAPIERSLNVSGAPVEALARIEDHIVGGPVPPLALSALVSLNTPRPQRRVDSADCAWLGFAPSFRKGLQPGAGVLMGAREDQPRDAERGRPRQPAKRRPSTPSPTRHRVGAHISGWDSLVRDAHRHATAKGSPEILGCPD